MKKIEFSIVPADAKAQEQATSTRAVWAAWIQGKHNDGAFDYAAPKVDQSTIDAVKGRTNANWIDQYWQIHEHTPEQVPYHRVSSNSLCCNFNWPSFLYTEIIRDVSGVLCFEAVKKYSSEVQRKLHEYKNSGGTVFPWMLQDWTESSQVFIQDYMPIMMIKQYGQGFVLSYLQDGEPFVGGFFTEQDKRRFRFTGKRLGAYLNSIGWDPERVRIAVEEAKAKHAGGMRFEVVPNDVPWGQLYVDGCSNVDSCMSRPAANYDSYDAFDVHPVDVYSSAYFGAGDNRLALVVSRDNPGEMTGRGIVQLQDGVPKLVRWYGCNNAYRALHNLGFKCADNALRGSWLAHIGDDVRFVHPYVDGNYCRGNASGGRVMLCHYDYDDEVDLQDTCGISNTGPTVYCAYNERYMPEQYCTYYTRQDVYINDRDADELPQCPVIGEPMPNNTYTVLHEGCDVEISGTAYYALFSQGRTLYGWCGFINKDGEREIQEC